MGAENQGMDEVKPDHGQIGYHVIRLDSWNLAKQHGANSFPWHGQRPGGHQFWCFRGQEDASWGLKTTLEREGERYVCPVSCFAERERRILDEFRRRSHLHVDSQAAGRTDIELLALIQHHGGPTRLLDFTYSFYVACFFALDKAEGDAAVWVMNLMHVRRAFSRRKGREDLRKPVEYGEEALMECNDAISYGSTHRGVMLVEPYQMSERLAAQQGTFLFPLNTAVSFEENLESDLELPSGCLAQVKNPENGLSFEGLFHKVLKIVLPRQIHKAAMKDLRQMNITSASLFPGLDGFARSLRWYLTP